MTRNTRLVVTAAERDAALDPRVLDRLGITDLESGLAVAHGALSLVWEGGKLALGGGQDWRLIHVAIAGLLARAQGFHEGAVAAITADNPYAAFTLLRAYAENVAALLYLKDKPQTVSKFVGEPNSPGVKPGVLTNYAKKHADGFTAIYEQLSQYAHPASRSLLASQSIVEDEDGTSHTWKSKSAPQFGSEFDRLMACAWTFELAEAHGALLRAFHTGP
jgi:hypothetical protein